MMIQESKRAADVLVVGLGPAGSSAALSLRQEGLSVSMIGQLPNMRFKVGESLSVDAKRLLGQLGVELEGENHLPCYGNRSSWGSPQLTHTDFIYQAGGSGWHLDRVGFEQQLLEAAKRQGVDIYSDTLLQQVRREGSLWRCTFRNKQVVEAKFLVDATGRNAWLSRRLGGKRTEEDCQLAMVAWMQNSQPIEDTFSLIEARPNGWWYTAALPGGKLVALMMVDPRLRRQEISTLWNEELANTQYTKNRVLEGAYQSVTSPKWVDASSSYLPSMYGDGWAAVGDAALCYDPIAAHGLTMALLTGRDAGSAVAAALSEDYSKLEAYQVQLKQAFAAYAYQRGQIYWQEQRWSDSAYWKERCENSTAFLRENGVWVQPAI